MRKVLSFALMTAIALTGTTVFTACSSNDLEEERIVYDDNGTAGVKSEFVISIPRKVLSITRMSDYVTQKSGDVDGFRGIDNIRLIPFNVDNITKTSNKIGDIMRLSAASSLSSPGAVNYKVYSDQFVPVGTKRFLFYGRAIANDAETEITTMDDKFKYGILNVQGLEESAEWTPSMIQFSLEQINTNGDAQANDQTGKNIVEFLTALANTTSDATSPNNKWSTTNVAVMASLYKQFTAITTSSSNTFAVILSKLYSALENIQTGNPARKLADNLKAKILTACAVSPINGEPVSLKSDYAGYPGNIGLPDGAVRVRWDAVNSRFKDVTAEYGQGFNEVITNYCYPAALWYFTNTPLKAANEKKSNHYEESSTWEGVINTVYNGTSDVVGESTLSVALTKAADYGVGRLETFIKMPSGTFYDANGNVVNVSKGYTMKGLLLGGQNSVGYQFTPKVGQNRTIYDRDITNSLLVKSDMTTSSCNQTLALETDGGQVIYAALELINNGEEFMGADGIIPAGGTFYLAVKLDPAEALNKTEVNIDQIIKQDYVTKLVVTIKNGGTSVDRDGDGNPDIYVKDGDGNITGVDTGDGETKTDYDINGDGQDEHFIADPDFGGPGWDTDGDGVVDIPIIPDSEGKYPDAPTIPDGLGNATNGIPNLTSPGVELGTSVDLEWKKGLELNPSI